jgi:hypothetical protein
MHRLFFLPVNDELVELFHELLVADPLSLPHIVRLAHTFLMAGLVYFMKLSISGCGCGVEHVDGFEVFGASALTDGQLGDQLSRGEVVELFIGDIQIEVADPIEIFVQFYPFLPLGLRYFLYFFELGKHILALCSAFR